MRHKKGSGQNMMPVTLETTPRHGMLCPELQQVGTNRQVCMSWVALDGAREYEGLTWCMKEGLVSQECAHTCRGSHGRR